ncbi:MAG: hypothetical protein HW421_1581 [Ignavibacteria bacterium]|nr:hypothetical protein [Ignavibacteria bacterium]
MSFLTEIDEDIGLTGLPVVSGNSNVMIESIASDFAFSLQNVTSPQQTCTQKKCFLIERYNNGLINSFVMTEQMDVQKTSCSQCKCSQEENNEVKITENITNEKLTQANTPEILKADNNGKKDLYTFLYPCYGQFWNNNPNFFSGITEIDPQGILTFVIQRDRYDRYTVRIDLSDCRKKFEKDIWCEDYQKNQKVINVFLDCIQKKLNIIYENNSYKNDNRVKADVDKRIKILINKISDNVYSFIRFHKWFSVNNKNSCLCGGNDDTYCCYPELDPINCKCPDGSLKNLCENCEKYYFDIRFNYNKQTIFPCSFPHDIAKGSNLSIQYTIYDMKGNILHKYDEQKINVETPQELGLAFRYIGLKIPSNINEGFIGISLYSDCYCCKKSENSRQYWLGSRKFTKTDRNDQKNYIRPGSDHQAPPIIFQFKDCRLC